MNVSEKWEHISNALGVNHARFLDTEELSRRELNLTVHNLRQRSLEGVTVIDGVKVVKQSTNIVA